MNYTPAKARFFAKLMFFQLSLFSSLLLHGVGKHQGDTLSIEPTDPASMSVNVRGGTVTLENGLRRDVKPARLEFKPPQRRTFTALLAEGIQPPAPANYSPNLNAFFNGGDRLGRNFPFIALTPPMDESGTPTQGHFQRVWQVETLQVYKTDGSPAVHGKDFLFNEEFGIIANLNNGLGIPGTGRIRASCDAFLHRIDTIQIDLDGTPGIKQGPATIAAPALPRADHSQTAVAGIHIAGWPAHRRPWIISSSLENEQIQSHAITDDDIFIIHPFRTFPPENPDALSKTIAQLRERKQVNILFIGDEILLGAEATNWHKALEEGTPGNTAWTSQVVHQLKGIYRGVSIEATYISRYEASSTWGLAQAQTHFAQQANSSQTHLTVIALGTHERRLSDAGFAIHSPETFENNIQGIIHLAKQNGSEVLLVNNLPPVPWSTDGSWQRAPHFNQILRNLAHLEKVALVPAAETFDEMSAEGFPPHTQLQDFRQRPGDLGHRMIAHAVIAAFNTAAGTSPLPKTILPPAVHPAPLPQPAEVAGHWTPTPQKLPPFESIRQAPRTRLPVYGLYSWQMEYIGYHEQVLDIGWPTLRLSGPITDEVMRLLATDNIEVMMTIAGRNPFPSPGFPQGEWVNRFHADSDEAFIETFVENCRWFLRRYGPGGTFFKDHPDLPYRPIRFLEIYNEPNLWYLDRARDDVRSHYPDPDPVVQAAVDANRQRLYADLLKASYKAVKADWPEVQIVGFSAAGVESLDIPFLRGIHERFPDIVDYYDIVSAHPYNRPAPPEGARVLAGGSSYSIANNLAEIRDILESTGNADKPIWYTELGWTVEPGAESVYGPASAHVGRDNPALLVAAYCVRMYIWALRLGVERVNLLYLKDSDRFNAGFFTNEQPPRPRPSAIAMREQIRLMPHPKLVDVLHEGENGHYAYWIQGAPDRTPRGDVLMVWNIEGSTTLTIPWDPQTREVIMVDMLGQRSKAPVRDGKILLETGPYPVYLLRP